jgi:hypothetical protein
MAQLTPGQVRVALSLDSPEPDARVAAARRLRVVFEHVTRGWRVDDSVFWRPALDPTLLLTSLRHDAEGLPMVPGTRRFWTSVFVDQRRAGREAGRMASQGTQAADFTWLCEQIFSGNPGDVRQRYLQVLFVSRLEARSAQWSAPEAVVAVRAAHEFPALVFSLERAAVVDVTAYAAAARRAERIAAIRDDQRAARALAQFQGAMALVTRTASRGGVQPTALSTAISSLSRVELSVDGDYEGRLVRWLTAWLQTHLRHTPAWELDVAAAGPVERHALAALAGPIDSEPRFVDWEGTRYQLDFAAAEAFRLARLLGDGSRPFLSSASALVDLAEAIGRDGLATERRQQHADTLGRIAIAVAWEAGDGWERTDAPRRYREARAALRQTANDTDGVRQTAAVLSGLADELLARGLMELAYAVALGHPDRPVISADEAARRHDFARPVAGRRSLAWELPTTGAAPGRGWHVTGALLGLDLGLADFTLVRLSLKPPPRKPTLAEDQRRVLVETVALVDAAALVDEDRTAIVSAIRQGRARLAAARTAQDAVAIADDIRLSPARRTLLSWTIANERESLPTFLSLSELLWLGLGDAPVTGNVHAWGVPAWPRTGCLCLEVLDRQPWETLTGRWRSGTFSSGFPDLNLRLAELLEELGMPAPLLAPVLAAATLDLVETAQVRDADDRHGLLDFVHALRRERVEQYLALLTTDGPLVPVRVDAGEVR